MEDKGSGSGRTSQFFDNVASIMRRCLFGILSVGPVPNHIAFIMDGNRRYAKRQNLEEGAGHKAGFLSLMSVLKYCYELGIKYVTVYAFSIDNFKRKPEEVKYLMDLMQEKIEGLLKQESIVNQYGLRVYFIGNLKLLSDPVRAAAEKAMAATSKNCQAVLLVCLAYTSTDEIVHAVQRSCRGKIGNPNGAIKGKDGSLNNKAGKPSAIKLTDIEKNMYMAVAPDPDIIMRSSGETRLSNFLLWQTTNCLLYYPKALWPDVGLWHLVWAVLNFQRNYTYLEKKKKKQL